MNGIESLVDFACEKLLGPPEYLANTLHCLNAVPCGHPWIPNVEIMPPNLRAEIRVRQILARGQ